MNQSIVGFSRVEEAQSVLPVLQDCDSLTFRADKKRSHGSKKAARLPTLGITLSRRIPHHLLPPNAAGAVSELDRAVQPLLNN